MIQDQDRPASLGPASQTHPVLSERLLASFRNVRPYLCPFASFANLCRDILHLANPNALIEIQAVGVIA
jgi:hypothetical protein